MMPIPQIGNGGTAKSRASPKSHGVWDRAGLTAARSRALNLLRHTLKMFFSSLFNLCGHFCEQQCFSRRSQKRNNNKNQTHKKYISAIKTLGWTLKKKINHRAKAGRMLWTFLLHIYCTLGGEECYPNRYRSQPRALRHDGSVEVSGIW